MIQTLLTSSFLEPSSKPEQVQATPAYLFQQDSIDQLPRHAEKDFNIQNLSFFVHYALLKPN